MPSVPAANASVARVPVPVEVTRILATAALLALIANGLAWELWVAPLRDGGSWWAIKVLPLALPLSGLLRRRLYTYRWVSLLVWPYVAEGVVRAFAETGPNRWMASAQTILGMTLFAACALHVRWRLRGARITEGAAP